MTRRLLCLFAISGMLLLPAPPADAQSGERPRRAPLRLPGSSLPRRAAAPDPPPRRPAPPPPVRKTTAPPSVTSRNPEPPPDASHPPVEEEASGNLSLARQLGLQVSRIVIDAGHGGRDPGATSHGLLEAEVVLDIARRLAQRLEAQPGVEVVMTRTGDTFVPLRGRTALANEVKADLFLSIHANASRNPKAHGVETYFLDFALDPEAEQIAARENLAASGTMKELESLLETIAANSKLRESREFAATIQRAMVSNLQPVNADVRDLGVKQAPFFVLIGARMPSVLAEVSFVTNRHEATLLATDAYRDRIADALLEGVLRYRETLDRAPPTTQQN